MDASPEEQRGGKAVEGHAHQAGEGRVRGEPAAGGDEQGAQARAGQVRHGEQGTQAQDGHRHGGQRPPEKPPHIVSECRPGERVQRNVATLSRMARGFQGQVINNLISNYFPLSGEAEVYGATGGAPEAGEAGPASQRGHVSGQERVRVAQRGAGETMKLKWRHT